MTSILDQLNFIRYSKDDFIKEKTKLSLVISSELESIIKLIETNIKKSGGSNSPFQNSTYNGGHKNTNYSLKSTSYNSKHGDSGKKGPSKSWRITKTKIVADNLSELDKNKNEINSLLNKLSPKNFDNLVPRIQEYYKKEDERDFLIESTIDNIFLKAVMQPVYCPYYVKLLKIMNKEYEKTEIINNKCIEFKTLLKTKVDEPKEEPVSEDGSEMTLSEKEKYDLFCKANKEKKYKEGYSQFIGELFNNEMINNITLEENVSLFVDSLESSTEEDAASTNVEDALICICKLFDTVSNREKNIIRTYCERVLLIRNNVNLPKRLQFKLMDLRDLLVKRKVLVV
jgi:hypothetical protein